MTRNYVKSSPLDLDHNGPLVTYVKAIKEGENKEVVKSIRNAFKAKDYDLMELEMEKLPTIGKKEAIEDSQLFAYPEFHLDLERYNLVQIEIPDAGRKVVYSLQSDKHTMIEHRNILDDGYILWFYFEGPAYHRSDAIDTLAMYLEEQYDLKLNLDKYKNPEDHQLEIGFDPRIYTNEHAAAFNFKYLKKKYESRKLEMS